MSPPLYRQQTLPLPPSPVFTVNTPDWSPLGQTGPSPAPLPPPCAYKSGGGATHLSPLRCHPLLAGCPPVLSPPCSSGTANPTTTGPALGTCTPCPAPGCSGTPRNPRGSGKLRHGAAPTLSRGVFSRRDPPALPYLKQEEPGGISSSPLPAFQYVLCAPTSPAVRHHEETLTYLNQGESGGAGEEGGTPPR